MNPLVIIVNNQRAKSAVVAPAADVRATGETRKTRNRKLLAMKARLKQGPLLPLKSMQLPNQYPVCNPANLRARSDLWQNDSMKRLDLSAKVCKSPILMAAQVQTL